MNQQTYIFVMERGFVLVGRPDPEQRDGLFVKLQDCAVIRRWGTTKGLGQLAKEGPQTNTILEPEPSGTEIKATAIYRRIPCNDTKWKGWPK